MSNIWKRILHTFFLVSGQQFPRRVGKCLGAHDLAKILPTALFLNTEHTARYQHTHPPTNFEMVTTAEWILYQGELHVQIAELLCNASPTVLPPPLPVSFFSLSSSLVSKLPSPPPPAATAGCFSFYTKLSSVLPAIKDVHKDRAKRWLCVREDVWSGRCDVKTDLGRTEML